MECKICTIQCMYKKFAHTGAGQEAHKHLHQIILGPQQGTDLGLLHVGFKVKSKSNPIYINILDWFIHASIYIKISNTFSFSIMWVTNQKPSKFIIFNNNKIRLNVWRNKDIDKINLIWYLKYYVLCLKGTSHCSKLPETWNKPLKRNQHYEQQGQDDHVQNCCRT